MKVKINFGDYGVGTTTGQIKYLPNIDLPMYFITFVDGYHGHFAVKDCEVIPEQQKRKLDRKVTV
jgi:hypothetical protein